jgi:hypothetical protein
MPGFAGNLQYLLNHPPPTSLDLNPFCGSSEDNAYAPGAIHTNVV